MTVCYLKLNILDILSRQLLRANTNVVQFFDYIYDVLLCVCFIQIFEVTHVFTDAYIYTSKDNSNIYTYSTKITLNKISLIHILQINIKA